MNESFQKCLWFVYGEAMFYSIVLKYDWFKSCSYNPWAIMYYERGNVTKSIQDSIPRLCSRQCHLHDLQYQGILWIFLVPLDWSSVAWYRRISRVHDCYSLFGHTDQKQGYTALYRLVDSNTDILHYLPESNTESSAAYVGLSNCCDTNESW